MSEGFGQGGGKLSRVKKKRLYSLSRGLRSFNQFRVVGDCWFELAE